MPPGGFGNNRTNRSRDADFSCSSRRQCIISYLGLFLLLPLFAANGFEGVVAVQGTFENPRVPIGQPSTRTSVMAEVTQSK